ncbi:MAG: M50 family metallopeptidase [Clostridia bacterium]
MTALYILLAIVLLGVLIMVHELGHFGASRLCGIAVKEFSIGFGPKLIQWKSRKHETLFTLRPIPLGGYCMFYGDTDDDPKGEKVDDPRNYNKAPVWKRLISVVAGPLMNLVLAFVVAIVLMAGYGQLPATPFVVQVEAGMPAAQAGLAAEDRFVSVGGKSMTDKPVTAVIDEINRTNDGSPIEMVVEREGEQKTFTVAPVLDPATGSYRVGVTIQQGVKPMPSGQYVRYAWDACVQSSSAILQALGKLFTTGEGLNETAGPIGVVQMVAQQTQEGGFKIFLNLLVLISINLGLVNLIPIPGLDGSRIVFMLLEAIRRKPVSQRIESAVHLCGYVFLLGVMILFTYKDIARLFGA